MTKRRDATTLPHVPAYVSREIGAAEICVSPATWDEWVKAGIIPQPCDLGISGTTPRWRWVDVDDALSRRGRFADEYQPEPFFRGASNGQDKDRRRAAS